MSVGTSKDTEKGAILEFGGEKIELKKDKESPAGGIDIPMLLKRLLCDHKIFEQCVQGLHWVAGGDTFFVMHEVYKKMYVAQIESSDALAKRILAMRLYPPVCYQCFIDGSRLEPVKDMKDAIANASWAYYGLEHLIKYENELIHELEKQKDKQFVFGTIDLLSKMVSEQQLMCWQLRKFAGIKIEGEEECCGGDK